MRGINKAIIVGNCTADPEIKYLPSGSAVCGISVATNEQWKDRETGEKKERAEFHNITFFGKLAEIVGEYVRKGSQVYVEGSIRTEKWTDKSGNDRYTTKIIGAEMQMLGGRPSGSGTQNAHNAAKSDGYQPQAAAVAGDEFNDDIPF